MKPTLIAPVLYFGHTIAWDAAEHAYGVYPSVEDEPIFHASTIDACVEAIGEVMADGLVCDAGHTAIDFDCEACAAEAAGEEAERREEIDALARRAEASIKRAAEASIGVRAMFAITCKPCGVTNRAERSNRVCPRCRCFDPELVEVTEL